MHFGFWDSWRPPLAPFYTKTIYASRWVCVIMQLLTFLWSNYLWHGFSICRVMTILIQITILHNYVCLILVKKISVLQSVDSTLLKGECIRYLYCLYNYVVRIWRFETEYLAHMSTLCFTSLNPHPNQNCLYIRLFLLFYWIFNILQSYFLHVSVY